MRLIAGVTVLLAALAIVNTHNIEKRQTRRLRARPGAKRRTPNAGPTSLSDPTPAGKRVVCYYTNWSAYRSGLAKFLPQNINPHLCTHLVYAFGGLTDEYEITVFDSWQDLDKGGYAAFNALKQYNSQLRTLLAIGGWNEGSGRFSELVSLPEYRQAFVLSAVKHLRRYSFDGLDLDWEYPSSRAGAAPEDKENYALLVKELKLAFEEESLKSGKPRLLLTMAVPAGQNYIDKGYDVPTLNENLDFFNILNYDYHVSVDPVVNNHAALLAIPGTSEFEDIYKLNVDWTVKYYTQLGADKHKLVVGIPTYGRSFALADPAFNEIGAAANGAGTAGNYTKEDGFMAFYEVCEAMSVAGWTAHKPYPRSVGPYATKDNQWVGYDDEGMVATKAEYVRDTGLGGIMFWSLDTDDFRGICNGQQYPLVEAGKAALLSAPPTNLIDDASSGAAVTQKPPVTPEPPTTPSPIPEYVCKREGFHPNPEDCHKYFWCLDSGAAGNGIVAHAFTCPSGLVFSRGIGGCEHPTSAKCKETKNRGGSDGDNANTTPRIPTTTPFPAFDYDYYYDYEDEDYLHDNAAPAEPVVIQDIAAKPDRTTSRQSLRNSGGAQFSRPETTAVEEEAGEVAVSQGRERNKPQYTAITRDRTATADAEAGAPVEESVAPPGGNARRPQYTSIVRDRPSPEEPSPDYEEGVTPGSRLQYVTIERQRSSSPGESLQGGDPQQRDELETATQSSGLQYVTLRRSSSRGTTPDTLLGDGSPSLTAIDSDSFRQRPQRVETTTEQTTITTTTTTTTTPRPARVVVPAVLLQPVTPSVVHRLNLDPRNRRRRPQAIDNTVELTTQKSRQTSRRSTTTEAAVLPLPLEKTIPEDSLDELYYDYDYVGEVGGEVSPTTVSDLPVVNEESSQRTLFDEEAEQRDSERKDAAVKDTTLDDTVQLDTRKEDSVAEDNTVVPLDVEPIQEAVEAAAEEKNQKTTVNLLAEFPVFTTPLPEEAAAAVEDVEAKELDSLSADAALTEATPVAAATEQPPLQQVSSAAVPVEVNDTASAPTTAAPRRVPQLPARRAPQLPPRPRRPETEAVSEGRTRQEATQRQRPQLASRFTPSRSSSVDSSVAESTTRRSVFRRPSQSGDQADDSTKDSTSSQSRFRPRGDAEQASTTAQQSTSERSRNRFGNTQTTENRFRLNPVAVTTEQAVTPDRVRRPRPSADRSRVNHQIRFRNQQEATTEIIPEVTAPVVVIDEDPVEDSEQPVTPNDLFATIFGGGVDAVNEDSRPLEHTVLNADTSVLPSETEASAPEPSPVTEPTFRFDDFFTSTTEFQDVIEDFVHLASPSAITTAASTTTPATTTPFIPRITTTETPTTPFRRVSLSVRTSAPPRAPVTPPPEEELQTRPSRVFEPRPTPATTTKASTPRRGGRPPKSRSSTGRPQTQIADYVYDTFYDDDDTGALGGTLGELADLTEKALLLPGGKVQCYDTGYFAHPDSCKKFISCSKTVRGAVRGWVYTCPQQLVFDPVGGMCNWAEAVDCKAPII